MTEAQRAELIEARAQHLLRHSTISPYNEVEHRIRSVRDATYDVDWFLAHLPAPALPADVEREIEALKAPYLRDMEMFRGECTSAEYSADELLEAIDRTAAIFRPLAQAERVPMPTGLHELEYPTAATDKGCVAFFDTRENMLAFMDWLTALAAPGDGE